MHKLCDVRTVQHLISYRPEENGDYRNCSSSLLVQMDDTLTSQNTETYDHEI